MTINLGSGFEVSIQDIVNLISEHFNIEIVIKTDNDRLRPEKSEVNRLLSDNSLAMKLLDWEPKYTGPNGLKKGISKTVLWFTDKKNLSKYPDAGYVI